MNHSSYYNLIDRGRKAGLNTRELYQAIASRRPDEAEQLMGQADSNGYVSTYNQSGQVVYRPGNATPRS
jgi:hypothetical protein